MKLLTEQDIYFFRTFGFLKIKNLFDKSDLKNLKAWFDSDYESFFNCSMMQILANSILKKRTYMVPSFADNDERILSLLYEKGLFDVASALLGKTMQYWGSDGSLFSYNSLWHRDTATIANRCKLNLYLNSGGKNSGAFRIIPGSHIIGDDYTNLLGNACAWPDSAYAGGLNETGLLPETKSPKNSLISNVLKKSLPDIPHHIIEFNAGDLLVFDDRSLHCVYSPIIPKPRRLITLLFTEYLDSDRITTSNQLDYSMQKVNDEICLLKQMECNQYSVDAYPASLLNFLNSKGNYDYVSKLSHLKPNVDRGYDGIHKEQHSELRDFLRRNYREIQ